MLTVQAATPDDVPALAELLEEMDRFYGVTDFDPIEQRTRQIHGLLFRKHPAAFVELAWVGQGDRAVGFAAYSFLWPAVGITQSLYLKELYVSESARRQGAGKQLMARMSEIAQTTDCSRMEWTTDRDNPQAMAFYQALGFEINSGKIFYRTEEMGSGTH